MNIRACAPQDISAICDIYNHYVQNTPVTFEETPLSDTDMATRVERYTKLYPWLVCEIDEAITGYAYASKWKERSAYKTTAEITVYLQHDMTAKGLGSALYSALIAELEKSDCHVALGCIALPNQASVSLHEYFGFEKVAHFPQVGRKFGKWIDVGYWQKTFKAS